MKTFLVIAVPWEHGYTLHITDGEKNVGVTQSYGTEDAEEMVRDYLVTSYGDGIEPFAVEIEFFTEE